VLGGIIPKMAIRFTSYESYKNMLADNETGHVTSKATFLGEYLPQYPGVQSAHNLQPVSPPV
jgi:hypothetical protein